jgi:hypothetical protein
MTKANVRILAKSFITDVTQRYTISDTDIDVMIRDFTFEIADLLCEYDHPYYKKSYMFSIASNAISPITGTTQPITESIKSLIYSYLNSDLNVNYVLAVTSLEGVNQADESLAVNGCISYSKTDLFVHMPLGVTSGTLYVVFYCNPNEPVDDNDEIDVPVEYLNHLMYLVKKTVYQRYNYPIPRYLDIELNKAELKLRG